MAQNIIGPRQANLVLIAYAFLRDPNLALSFCYGSKHNWTASSEFGTYRLCEQRRFRRACASAQSRQNLRCSLIQAVNQEELSDRKPDPWPLWMAGHAQLKFVMTECSKTQIRLTGLIKLVVRAAWRFSNSSMNHQGNCIFKCWSLRESNISVAFNYLAFVVISICRALKNFSAFRHKIKYVIFYFGSEETCIEY